MIKYYLECISIYGKRFINLLFFRNIWYIIGIVNYIYKWDDIVKNLFLEFLKEFREQFKSIKTNGIKKQIPNILTFSRAIAPLIIVPTILFERIDIAILELVFFAITDFLDGRLARKYNCV